jgi:acetyl-CoA C-acetyltransferase
VDVQCGSSQEAFTLAYALVAAGLVEVAVAAGVESMSRVPMGYTFTSGPGNPIPPSFLERFPMPDQFASAERIAAKWGVTREDCDALAVASATRAAAAWEQARFAGQIVAAHGLERDECLRVTSSESVAALAPIAPGAVHTAATASKIADGASAVLLMSARRAEVLALTPKVTVRDSALIGVDPSLMLTGPIDVTEMLLQRNNFSATDLAVVEINEAFASVALAWAAEFDVDPARVNPNGGALAMGHPLGATGTGLITKAIHELERIGSGHALVTMCCGGALGTGTLMSR